MKQKQEEGFSLFHPIVSDIALASRVVKFRSHRLSYEIKEGAAASQGASKGCLQCPPNRETNRRGRR